MSDWEKPQEKELRFAKLPDGFMGRFFRDAELSYSEDGAIILSSNLMKLREKFLKIYNTPAETRDEALRIQMTHQLLEETFNLSSKTNVSKESRIRGITDALTHVAKYYTKEIPELFEGYEVGPKVDGTYYPETNVRTYSSNVEPTILFALRLKEEGKSIPDHFEDLYQMFRYDEILKARKLRYPDLDSE